jgi:hypothetical protein
MATDYTGHEPTRVEPFGEPFEGSIANAAGMSDIADMTDRELLEEIVMQMRTVGAALATFQKMGPGGMMKAVMTGNFTGGQK